MLVVNFKQLRQAQKQIKPGFWKKLFCSHKKISIVEEKVDYPGIAKNKYKIYFGICQRCNKQFYISNLAYKRLSSSLTPNNNYGQGHN